MTKKLILWGYNMNEGMIDDGNLDAIKEAIKNGADIEMILDEYNGTAITLAFEAGHHDIVRYLIENGSDINHKDHNGKTIVMGYAELGLLKEVKKLVELGAEINDITSYSESALSLSVEEHPDIALYLLERGANPNLGNNLLLAIEENHTDLSVELIKKGAKLDIEGFESPLITASIKQNEAIVRALIEYGVSANVTSIDNKTTPLLQWAESGSQDLIELLVVNGGNVSDLTMRGENLLYLAAKSGDIDKVEYFLNKGLSIEHEERTEYTRYYNNDSPLLVAAQNDHDFLVRYLIEKGADVNAAESNESALMIYAEKGNLKAVKFLLKHNADPNIENNKENAYILAARNGHLEVIKLLEPLISKDKLRENHDKSLKEAGYGGHVDVLKYLKSTLTDSVLLKAHHEQLMKMAEYDWTSYMSTTRRNGSENYSNNDNVALLRYLVDEGADLTKKGDLYLLNAAKQGHVGILSFLISHGFNINYRDNYKGELSDTPLLAALKNGNIDCAKLLINLQAKSNLQNNKNEIPLHYASRIKDGETLDLLLKLDRSLINKVNQVNNESSLQIAIKNRCYNNALKLIDNGADINLSDAYGKTPLMNLISNKKEGDGSSELLEKLLKNSNINQEDLSGQTVLFSLDLRDDGFLLQKILERNIDVDHQNNLGNSALMRLVLNNKIIPDAMLIGDINITNNNGNTALMLAAQEGNKFNFEKILSMNPDTSIRNYEGHSAINLVDFKGEKEIVDQLIRYEVNNNKINFDTLQKLAEQRDGDSLKFIKNNGMDLNVLSKSKENILFSSVDSAVFFKKLVSFGVDINQVNVYGDNLLFKSVHKKTTALTELLIKGGLNVNHENGLGNNALMELSRQNIDRDQFKLMTGVDLNHKNYQDESLLMLGITKLTEDGRISNKQRDDIDFLLSLDVDINLQNRNGESIIMFKSVFKDKDLLLKLIDKGADLTLKNRNGDTLLDLVKRTGDHELTSIVEKNMLLNDMEDETDNVLSL